MDKVRLKKPTKSILIHGNTYCSSRVYFDGVEVIRLEWQYGYGNFYEQAARQAIRKVLRIGKSVSFFSWLHKNKLEYTTEVFDGLKRDMVAWGKTV